MEKDLCELTLQIGKLVQCGVADQQKVLTQENTYVKRQQLVYGLLWESHVALEMVAQYSTPDSNQCDVLNCMLLTIKKMKTKMHLNGIVHSQKYLDSYFNLI